MKDPIFTYAAISRRADALFKTMSSDFLLREQFITDPSQVLSEYVHGKSISPESASISNQLLYSIMSNPGLVEWLRHYSIHRKGAPPSREKFIFDLSHAVIKHNGHHVLIALARSIAKKEPLYSLDEVLLPVVFSAFAGMIASDSGTEVSTGTYATEQSGTHISGGIFQSGTDMSTGTYATEQSGTHISGGIFQSGTDMSTGTYATEQSGTHISGGIVFSEYALVTLDALAQYAMQLRNTGALDSVFV